MPDAVDVAITEAKNEYPTFEYGGETWEVRRRPPTLMLAEFARTDEEDAESISLLAEFFSLVLGDQYSAFKRKVYAAEDDTIVDLFHHVLEISLGRPTV
jgi:hypothetical protein